MAVESEPKLSRQDGERYIFQRRPDKGSIGNLSTAAAVAVSSFDMRVQDPQPFINKIDWALFDRMRAQGGDISSVRFEYSDPSPLRIPSLPIEQHQSGVSELPTKISGKVQRFGDNIDTDMVGPSFLF